MINYDDNELIAAYLAGNDQAAFGELVRRHQSRLRYSLRQLTGWNEALADDLAQETLVKAYRGLRQYQGGAKFSTWLYRIACNELASYYRKQGNRPLQPLPEEQQATQHGPSDLHRDLARAMLEFPVEQRVALHLHLEREYSHQEVADMTNMPLGTVKSHITRGKNRLREMLSAWEGEVHYDC